MDFSNIQFLYSIKTNSNPMVVKSDFSQGFEADAASLAEAIQNVMDVKLEFVNMGSGLGIPYASDDVPLDTAYLGKTGAKLISKFEKNCHKLGYLLRQGAMLSESAVFM